MSGKPTCPKCQSSDLAWTTLRKSVPVDVLQCKACGEHIAEEDWIPPLLPLVPGRCINCGERRELDRCSNCGLTREEDVQVHDELRYMISPRHGLFDAARIANRAGRRLIALKLATAAAASNEEDKGEQARSMRVWLLQALGEPTAALDDAKTWVEASADASALAWASYGQQLQANAFPGAAADAYHKALRKDPTRHILRARRAQILLQLHREGQAIEEAIRVLESARADEQAIAGALEVAGRLCDLFESQLRDDEIERMLEKAGPNTESSARLLAHRARLAAVAGNTALARRDLKRARSMEPDLDIYDRVEQALRPTRSSWWRW